MNVLLTSHVWRQDHNGFSHQDPGFIDLVVNKKGDIIRVFLAPDANTLLYITDWCLRSRNFVNVIVAGKQPQPQWLDIDQAVKDCATGVGIWDWASNDQAGEPDVVMAAAGDVPTVEILAAIELLRQHAPELKIRMIKIVDLMTLQPREEHPHGLSDWDFDSLFTGTTSRATEKTCLKCAIGSGAANGRDRSAMVTTVAGWRWSATWTAFDHLESDKQHLGRFA